MTAASDPRGASAPGNGVRPIRHTCSSEASYGDDPPTVKGKQPLREHYPNLSPTRPPATADRDVWARWKDVPVEQLNFDLFDDDGHPVGHGRGAY